eukprot:g6753.t1
MPGQRRYGSTKGSKLAGLGNTGEKAAEKRANKIPLLSGERREIRVPSDEPASEQQPLLLGSGSEDGGPRRRGGRGGGGGGAFGDGDAFGAGSSRRDNNKVITGTLILSYMIGSGILNAPQVFQGSGIGPATILYIVSASAVWLGIVVLVNASEVAFPRGYARGSSSSGGAAAAALEMSEGGGAAGGGGSGGGLANGDGGRLDDIEYAHLAMETVGPLGAKSVDAFIVINNFGDVCSYVILVGSLTASLLLDWFGASASDAWWASFSVVTPVMAVLFVFPPCLIRHFSNLRWLSVLSFCAITAVVGLVVIGGPIYSNEERETPGHDPDLDSSVVWWNWPGSVAQLGSIVFALSCAPAALHGYTSMTPRSTRAWRSVATWTIVTGACLCYAMGLAGYLSFRDSVDGDILLNFSGTLASVFKLAVVVHLVLYIPSEVIVMRHSLYALRGEDVMAAGFEQVAWVTFAILALVVGAMVGLNAVGIAQGDLFGYILDVTGGVSASVTSFILPGLIYLGVTGDTDGRGLSWPLFEGGGPAGWGSGAGGKGGALRDVGFFRLACKGLVVFGGLVFVAVPVGVVADIAGW